MNLSRSSSANEPTQAIKELSQLAFEIERKFDSGRASDIHQEFVQRVIMTAKTAQRTTKDPLLMRLLENIEEVAYAILASEKTPDYYRYLRQITNLLRDLKNIS